MGASIEMISYNIGEGKKEGQGIKLSCNNMILLHQRNGWLNWFKGIGSISEQEDASVPAKGYTGHGDWRNKDVDGEGFSEKAWRKNGDLHW